jgi:DNA-binding IclR family transcriptional regulator
MAAASDSKGKRKESYKDKLNIAVEDLANGYLERCVVPSSSRPEFEAHSAESGQSCCLVVSEHRCCCPV